MWNGVSIAEGAKTFARHHVLCRKLRVALKDQHFFSRFRTKAEDGKVALARQKNIFIFIQHTVLATDCADLIDIEFFTAGAELPALIEEAHTAGLAVVCSATTSMKRRRSNW